MALKTKFSPFQRLSLENLYNALLGLAPREKLIALIGVGVVLVLILFLPFSLVSGKIRSLHREIAAAQKGLKEVETKIGEYEKARGEISAMERKFGRGGSITSRVEGAARQVGLAVGQLKEKPPQETDYLDVTAVEIQFSGATLSQVVDFLKEIEQGSPTMRVRRVQIKPKYTSRQLLDVSMEVATFALKGET